MIYFAQRQDGLIKIGRSDNVAARMATLSSKISSQLRVLKVIEGHSTEEFNLHTRFKDIRVFGEWFSPSSDLVSFIDGQEGCEFRDSPIPDGYVRMSVVVSETANVEIKKLAKLDRRSASEYIAKLIEAHIARKDVK